MDQIRTPLFRKRSHLAFSGAGASFVFILLATVLCCRSHNWLHGDSLGSRSKDEATITVQPFEPAFLGRNINLRALEQQIHHKNTQISHLKTQLEQIRATDASHLQEAQHQDSLLLSLHGSIDQERASRTKAHLALAQKASALDFCSQHTGKLTSKLQACTSQLTDLQQLHRQQYEQQQQKIRA